MHNCVQFPAMLQPPYSECFCSGVDNKLIWPSWRNVYSWLRRVLPPGKSVRVYANGTDSRTDSLADIRQVMAQTPLDRFVVQSKTASCTTNPQEIHSNQTNAV